MKTVLMSLVTNRNSIKLKKNLKVIKKLANFNLQQMMIDKALGFLVVRRVLIINLELDQPMKEIEHLHLMMCVNLL